MSRRRHFPDIVDEHAEVSRAFRGRRAIEHSPDVKALAAQRAPSSPFEKPLLRYQGIRIMRVKIRGCYFYDIKSRRKDIPGATGASSFLPCGHRKCGVWGVGYVAILGGLQDR